MAEHRDNRPSGGANPYRTFFNSLEQGACIVEMIVDDDGEMTDYRFVDVNPIFERQTGLEEPVGKRARELIPDLDEFWVQTYRRVATSREPLHFENHASDVERWFDVYAFPIGEPEKYRVALVFSDITERKYREQNAAFLADINDDFSRLSGSEEIMDTVGRKLADFMNVSRVVFTEIDEEADKAYNIYDYHEPGLPDVSGELRLADYMSPQFIAEVQSGEPVAIDDISGDWRTSEFLEAYRGLEAASKVHVPHYSEGRWKFMLAVFHDHPHRWRRDEVELLRNLTARLWHRIERARAMEAIREADKRKERFLGVLSHELRNPLTPIRLSLDLMEHVEPGSDDDRQARETIERQTNQLARLVDDLLDVTRITRDKIDLHCEPIELNELIRETTRDHRPIFDDKGIDFDVELPEPAIFVDADRNRLSQVVGNLLQNAAKFTEPQGRVTVTSAVDADDDGDADGAQAEIRVVDTGIGLDPETLDTLFEPFAQVDSSLAHTTGGLGLGLALVQQLVDLHGGQVEVHSDGVGQGAEFVVRLPATVEERPAAPDVEAGSSSKKLQILVIEDNPDIVESLQMILQLKGHDVFVETDGKAGVETARREVPEVVICDIGLPGMDGFAVARTLNEDRDGRPELMIALSGYARPEDLEQSAKAGFDHHLAKPLNLEKLDELLASHGG